ncbi:MAG: MBL fold metallo-hydrolase [candidate division WWE3 bacterium]|nr:MBL fold metallo-hydrolase [candidate division WWE3 bacterium]
MKIQYLGHSSFKITSGPITIVTDPFDPAKVGLPYPKIQADLVLSSHDHFDHHYLEAIAGEPFVINAPGEYEVKGVKVRGFQTFHDDKGGVERGKNTVYLFEAENLSLCHLGDLGHLLDEKVVEEFEDLDVLFVPVGGVYTIGPSEASKIVSKLEPKIIVPMHYRTEGMGESFKDLQPVTAFLGEMGLSAEALAKAGLEQAEPRSELTLSSKSLPPEPEVIVLRRA